MKITVPFFSLKRQWDNLKPFINPEIHSVLESNQYIGGPSVLKFEQTFSRYTGAKYAVACNSGTDALWLALKALNAEKNSIVLTTPFSFIASSSEIVAHGAHPVFIDIDETYNICPKKIESWLKLNATCKNKQATHKLTGKKISGIITVDLFGQCADYDAIKTIADEWGLWIIEDACQAVGAHINNNKTGTLGDISCFSLYPTKNLGAFGDGGVLTTNNKNLAETLLKLRNHGRKSHYEYEYYGRNSRLDAIQAVATTEKLKYLDSFNDRRRQIANTYNTRFANLPFIQTPIEKIGHHVYHQYCVRVIDNNGTSFRDTLQEHLKTNNIGTNIFYPKGLHQIQYLQTCKELKTKCPVAEAAINSILALPVWPELTDKEINYICEMVESCAVRARRFYKKESSCEKTVS